MKTHIPEIKNPLQHSGTNKFERLATEMAFDFVQIEERHESDFLAYAEKLSSAFQYYDSFNRPFGNWQSFFNVSTPSNRPHKALFIAFLRLLEALNEHANGLGKRHLDFYYTEVLQFMNREAKPAQVHIFLQCAKALKERFVAQNQELFAGETPDGQAILFRLVDEIVINHATISDLYAVYRHPDQFGNRLFAKNNNAFVNKSTEGGFTAFGESQLIEIKDIVTDQFVTNFNEVKTMDDADLGIALSSPILRLSEGERTICLDLSIQSTGVFKLFPDQFLVTYTGQTGWVHAHIASFSHTDKNWIMKLELKDSDPACTNYNSVVHGGYYQSKNPVLRILLNPNPVNGYGYFEIKNVAIKDVKLQVSVKNFRSLIVQNEISVLDPSKPFFPFGPIPADGDHFYVGHSDIFNHVLSDIEFKIKWKDIPNSNFSNHYANYSVPVSNEDFKVKAYFLQDKVWINSTTESQNFYPLFGINAQDEKKISLEIPPLNRQINSANNVWNYQTNHGYIRFTLSGNNNVDFRGFGHKNYPKEIQRIGRTNAISNTQIDLNQPYTPVIEQLVLNYTTKEILFSNHEADQFYHVTHYGQNSINLSGKDALSPLFPQFHNEGELYLGLMGVSVPQSVAFLFQFAEGSGDADQSQIKSGVQWFYLVNNDWKALDPLRISKDTTRNLLNTGILRFDLPDEMNTTHQIMPPNKFWLKASIPSNVAGIDRIQAIYAQAVIAEEVAPEISTETISPNTISKLTEGGNGVAKIEQPFASFGGTSLDSEEIFYARSTERLRHKDRGVMIWDYERLVLDTFPDLYKVKCLNHTNYQTELVAGHVMIAVIPNLRNKGLKSPFQPKLSIHKRMDIYDYLRERISPFIYLRVENPIYEPIQLAFNVGFHKGFDEGFYGKKLHDELQSFLSPWAFENELNQNSDLVFGGELHKSTFLKFIEDREYVDFVNHFNMYHTYKDPSIENRFNQPALVNPQNAFSSHETEGPCERIKMKFIPNNPNEATLLMDLKVRFLHGLEDFSTGNISPREATVLNFRHELHAMLTRRYAKGEQINKSLVHILIKNMVQVDKVVSFEFYKILSDNYVMEDVDVAIAKTSRSIMVSAEQHRIGVYRAGDYNCEGNVVIGIGYMIVEADFIIPIKEEKNEQYAR
jgi:hypothetical protein